MPYMFDYEGCQLCAWKRHGMTCLEVDEISDKKNHAELKHKEQQQRNDLRRLQNEHELHRGGS